MVGSPGKRAMLADMGESGQCGVRGLSFSSQPCVGSDGLFASKPAPTGLCAGLCFCGSGLAREGYFIAYTDCGSVRNCDSADQLVTTGAQPSELCRGDQPSCPKPRPPSPIFTCSTAATPVKPVRCCTRLIDTNRPSAICSKPSAPVTNSGFAPRCANW
ncbi:hypothetical protein D3C73_1082540 [compost metagenome]